MNDLLSQHPEIIAIAIALAGLVIARLLAGASGAGLTGLERLLRRFVPSWVEDLDTAGFRPVVRSLTFYLTLFLFLLLALHTLNLAVVEEGLERFIDYLPSIILAVAILLAGYLLGLIAHAAIASMLPHTGSRLLPYLAQFLIMVVAVLTALSQLAIDISFLTLVITILLATFLGGLALAFALGSRQAVANVLARRELRVYRIGNRIRIGEIEGVIIDMRDTAVVLEHPGGATTVPASRFASEPVTLVSRDGPGQDDDGD